MVFSVKGGKGNGATQMSDRDFEQWLERGREAYLATTAPVRVAPRVSVLARRESRLPLLAFATVLALVAGTVWLSLPRWEHPSSDAFRAWRATPSAIEQRVPTMQFSMPSRPQQRGFQDGSDSAPSAV